MTTKPDFILVPGAWHGPESFDRTSNLLTAQGYVVHGISLPSVGASPHLQSFDLDVETIRTVVSNVLASGKDVVMLYHSYGGVVGSEALDQYVKDLESGTKKEGWGKVRRLVYCCAFALPEGASLMTALNGKPLPWFIIDGDEVNPHTPEKIFYNDLDAETASAYVQSLKPHSYPAFSSTLSVAPWKVIPSTYVLCERDAAIPDFAQEGMIQSAQALAPNAFDVVERIDAGHSPFISRPAWLAEKLVRAAGA